MRQDRFIDVNGVRLHVILAGPENGSLAILLHGFPEFWSSYMFWFLVPKLPEALMRIGAHRPMFASIRRTARPEAFGDEDEAPYRRAWDQPGALTGMVNWYRALLRFPPHAASARVAVPTLVVWGEREQFAQLEMAHESLELCDRGELVVIRGATHWVHHEEAGRVNALLLEFASASNR